MTLILAAAVLVASWLPLPTATPTHSAPAPQTRIGTALTGGTPRESAPATGWATWYAAPAGTAAAGPGLRTLLGSGWRGSTVRVCSGGRCVRVRLADFCQCYRGTSHERYIDLSRSSFAQLADPSRGVIKVTVSW